MLEWSRKFASRSEAMKAEKWIKRMKSRNIIEKIISEEIDLIEILES